MTGAAGSTSKQLSMKQRGEELFTVGKLKEGGGTEGHDVMYPPCALTLPLPLTPPLALTRTLILTLPLPLPLPLTLP